MKEFTLKDFLAAVFSVLAPVRLHRYLRSRSHERPVDLTPQNVYARDSVTLKDLTLVGVVKMAGVMPGNAHE
jgi:hypothetical protein